MTPKVRLATAILLLLAAGCSTTPVATDPVDSPTSPASSGFVATPAPRPTSIATAVPSSTPWATVHPDRMPSVLLDPAATTTICDPEIHEDLLGGADIATIRCAEGVALALGALRTTTPEPVTRILLSRPDCHDATCARAAATSAVVTLWSADGTRSWQVGITVDEMEDRIASQPIEGAWASWPEVEGSAPPSERPHIPGAPPELADRVVLPFCGDSEPHIDAGPWRCFLAAVVSGRPAELVEQLVSTHGDPMIRVYRYAGEGAVVMWQGAFGIWRRYPGGLVLGPELAGFSFEQWDAGDVVVPDDPDATIERDGWGRIWGRPPEWWTLPPGALAIEDDTFTLLYGVSDPPGTAMRDVSALLDAQGFTAEGRDRSPTWEQARFTDGSRGCGINVVARGAPGGSVVEVIYPVGCPHR